MKITLLTVLMAIGLLPLTAQTCDTVMECTCAIEDFSPAGIMLGHEHLKNEWKISYRYMFNAMNGMMSGDNKITEAEVLKIYTMAPASMRMNMHMLMVMYGFTDRFSVMSMLNFNSMNMQMNMLTTSATHNHSTHTTSSTSSTHPMSSSTQGIGDVQVYGIYSLFNNGKHLLLFNQGINVPVGSINISAADTNGVATRLPYMMQNGSGTLDFMPCITYLMRLDNFSWSTQVSSTIRAFDNKNGYRLGNDVNLNIWGAYKFVPWMSASVRLESTIKNTIHGKDATLNEYAEPAANTKNYGGEYVYSYAGFNFYIAKGKLQNNRISIEGGLPVYQRLEGIQLTNQATVWAAWMYSF